MDYHQNMRHGLKLIFENMYKIRLLAFWIEIIECVSKTILISTRDRVGVFSTLSLPEHYVGCHCAHTS